MKKVICILFLLFPFFLFAQKDRKVAVLDMTVLNNETNSSRLFSVERMLRSAGIPFETTDNIDSAVLYPVILTGSRIENGNLSVTQENSLINYVDDGGVLITSSMRDSALFDLCGITGFISEDTMFSITWDINSIPYLFGQINDSLEITVSLGDTSDATSFFARGYYLGTGIPLGNYDNGFCALARNIYGNGKVYTFGPDFRDIYLRNQLDYDLNAHRTYSNGFEPTSDVFMFIIRNIIRENISNTVYTYTSPGKSSASVLITHDIDSESAMDTMLLFADFEVQRNIVGQYNITTRYFNDGWMTSFYVGSVSQIQDLKDYGHVISSHSVGHFPDFADGSIFPFGTLGNTATNYQPFYTGGITTDGTLLGELEVSKNLLEEDHEVNIRSFRAGHLAFHDSLAVGLNMLDYEFNSTHSANNILTGFPFYDFYVRSFNSTESPVLQIPMTISDVFNTDPINSSNYMQKVKIWVDASRKYFENHAPVNLLVHPNRLYKLSAQQAYLDSLPADVSFINMEAYGDFWRKRDSLRFHTEKTGNNLHVHMDNDVLHPEQSFVIDTIGLDTVLFFDYNGIPLEFDAVFHANGQLLFYPHVSTESIQNPENNLEFSLYPNPNKGNLHLIYDKKLGGGNGFVYDLNGKCLYSFSLEQQGIMQLNLPKALMSNGMYWLVLDRSPYHISRSFIYSE